MVKSGTKIVVVVEVVVVVAAIYISRISNNSSKEVILVVVRLRVRKIVASRKRFPSRYGSRPGFAEQERTERLVIEVAI